MTTQRMGRRGGPPWYHPGLARLFFGGVFRTSKRWMCFKNYWCMALGASIALVIGGWSWTHRIPIPPLGRNLPAPASLHSCRTPTLGGRTKAPGHQQQQRPAQLQGDHWARLSTGEVAVAQSPGWRAALGRIAPMARSWALPANRSQRAVTMKGRHTRPLVVIWSSLPCSYDLSSLQTLDVF